MSDDQNNQQPVDEVVDQGGDEGGGEPAAQQPDRLQNLQAEVYRKLQNMDKSTNDKFDQILNMIAQKSQAPAAPEKSLKDLVFEDPDKAAEIIEQRATARAQAVVTQQVQASQQVQSTVADMQSKYPEFAQEGSEAARVAIEKAGKLPAHLRGTPEGIRMVMLETASDLGLVPAGKRAKAAPASDDFVTPGSAPSSRSAARKQDVTKDIDPNTLGFAQLLDPTIVNDPKRLENLAKASKRKNWTRYSS